MTNDWKWQKSWEIIKNDKKSLKIRLIIRYDRKSNEGIIIYVARWDWEAEEMFGGPEHFKLLCVCVLVWGCVCVWGGEEG